MKKDKLPHNVILATSFEEIAHITLDKIESFKMKNGVIKLTLKTDPNNGETK